MSKCANLCFLILKDIKHVLQCSKVKTFTFHVITVLAVASVCCALKGWLAIAKLNPLSLFISPF